MHRWVYTCAKTSVTIELAVQRWSQQTMHRLAGKVSAHTLLIKKSVTSFDQVKLAASLLSTAALWSTKRLMNSSRMFDPSSGK